MAEEGKHGVGFFVIESGTAKVTVHGEERRTLGPGSHFGEVALIDDGVRTATVTADTDVTAHVLVAWDFRPMVQGGSRAGLGPSLRRGEHPPRARRLASSREP